MRTTVGELLEDKGTFVLTISSDATALEALETMFENNVGSILIQDGNKVRGILTDRDYLGRVVLEDDVDGDVPVETVMASDMVVVTRSDSIEHCMTIMTQQRIRYLPVVEEGELKGIISIGDCVKRLSRQDKVKINHLKSYIAGEYPR